jgi:hypothetical protein
MLFLFALPALAQERALVDAPACRTALAALDTKTAERAPRDQLQSLRQRAAAACLRAPETAASQPVPRTRAQAPIAVPPIATAAPRPIAIPTPPVSVPAPTPLVTLTGCDATGCWASNGTRLQRVGESNMLLGPNGVTCTQSGALLNCPR